MSQPEEQLTIDELPPQRILAPEMKLRFVDTEDFLHQPSVTQSSMISDLDFENLAYANQASGVSGTGNTGTRLSRKALAQLQETIMEGVEKRQRMQFPLGEMLHALREFKDFAPQLETLPKKLLRIDQEVIRLQQKLETDYMTVARYKLMNQYQSSDLQAIVDNIASQTMNKVETLIETRIPFDQMRELVNQRGAMESFKSAERRIQRVNADFESMRQKFELMENELQRTDKLLFGFIKYLQSSLFSFPFGFLRNEHILPLIKIVGEYDQKWLGIEPKFTVLQDQIDVLKIQVQEQTAKSLLLQESIQAQQQKVEEVSKQTETIKIQATPTDTFDHFEEKAAGLQNQINQTEQKIKNVQKQVVVVETKLDDHKVETKQVREKDNKEKESVILAIIHRIIIKLQFQ